MTADDHEAGTITVVPLPDLPDQVAQGLPTDADAVLDLDVNVTAGLLDAFRARAFHAGYERALDDVRASLDAAAERFMFEHALGLNLRPIVQDFGEFLARYVRELGRHQGVVSDGLGI